MTDAPSPRCSSGTASAIETLIKLAISDGEYIGRSQGRLTPADVIGLRNATTVERLRGLRAILDEHSFDDAQPSSGTEHAPEVFMFYRHGQLHHIHTDRKVFDDWIKKSPWQYPPEQCEIVRYVPDVVQAPWRPIKTCPPGEASSVSSTTQNSEAK